MMRCSVPRHGSVHLIMSMFSSTLSNAGVLLAPDKKRSGLAYLCGIAKVCLVLIV